MVMRRSQRQRFQPFRLDYRLPGVPSSTPTAAQFLQIPSAAETSPEQRSTPPLTPVRQFERSVIDGEIEDTIQRLQGEMDAITRELGEMNVRCSSSSDSRHGFILQTAGTTAPLNCFPAGITCVHEQDVRISPRIPL